MGLVVDSGRRKGVSAVNISHSASQGRYGQGRRFNPLVVLLVILIHAGLFALVTRLGPSFKVGEAPKVFTVNLISSPPPPPPADAPPPPPRAPEVVVPRPQIDIPRIDPPMVAARPDIPVVPVIAPGPPAPPRPAAAPISVPSVTNGGDLGTQMVAGKAPRYPIESRRKREQGVVLLALTVGLDGCVEDIRIARSSGFTRLDKAALDAVKRWRWRPTLRDGQPVFVKGVVEIPFVIQPQDNA
ncbi:protein TonB [Sphingobium sp. B2D3A]|uniref:energy transducer TonB n=1 Tax=unclassified Sphingobium TaxID=2611147 RepID=UPI00222457AB|nr:MULTISPECIES: energy transducer TonB [unclassified Sphingobium]MCW2337251.1 protein TonB [Sphingobium sp. B2D3A]MCW2383709.1 protein TonB [Sphingobium sp. B2D3D]